MGEETKIDQVVCLGICTRLEKRLDDMENRFVTKSEWALHLAETDRLRDDVLSRIDDVKALVRLQGDRAARTTAIVVPAALALITIIISIINTR